VSELSDTNPTRVYFTGDCDGLTELRDALAQHPELDVVGSSEYVAQAAISTASSTRRGRNLSRRPRWLQSASRRVPRS
jgi:hypothetical protein